MFCIEETICDNVETFRRPSDSAPGALYPLFLLRYALEMVAVNLLKTFWERISFVHIIILMMKTALCQKIF